MPSASELFQEFAVKVGIPADDAALKVIVTNAELMKVVVSDDMAAKMQSGLHTLESARSVLKPQLKNEIKAEIYNGVDTELYELAKENGLDDAGVEELKKLDKTSARLKTVASKIKELSKAATGSTGKEKQELIEQINTLKSSQADIAKQHLAAIEAVKGEADNEIAKAFINSHLGGYNYANDAIPKSVNVTTANVLLNAKLAEMGAVVKYDKTTGKLKAVKQDGSDLYDAKNNKLTFETLSDQLVAENKLIKTSDSPRTGGGNNGNGGGNPPDVQTGLRGNRFGSDDLDALITEAQAGYKA